MPENIPQLRELTSPEMPLLYPLIKQLNPDIDEPTFGYYLADMLKNHYRCVGAWQQGQLVGAIGFWTHTRFWAGLFLEVDNVVVDEKARGLGIGALLSDWVDAEAKKMGASRVMAAVYATNTDAHRFYYRQRYNILGFYFTKKLG